jgi:phage shock protein PspC (stress-responsive transcriptional regulator)
MPRRLERSTTNRVISGVCGGLGEYLSVDATLVRAFFVIAGLFSAGLFILVYIAMLILMPLPGKRAPIDDIWPSARTSAPPSSAAATSDTATSEVSGEAPPYAAPSNGEEADRRRATIGYVLVALGVIFLLSNAGAFRFIQWNLVWPLVVIALGALLIIQRSRR